MANEWNKPEPTYELSSDLEQPPAGKIVESRTVYSVSDPPISRQLDMQEAAREGTPTLTDSDGNDLYPPAVCNWIVWSEERIIALERDLASATAALAEERARADEAARLHVSASENAHMHYKNSVHWKQRAELAEAERDALALALVASREECAKACETSYTEWGGKPTNQGKIFAAAIRALDPPSRERGEALLLELEGAKRLHGELLYAVARKFPGESRHDTALRYIRKCESNANAGGPTDAAGSAIKEGRG